MRGEGRGEIHAGDHSTEGERGRNENEEERVYMVSGGRLKRMWKRKSECIAGVHFMITSASKGLGRSLAMERDHWKAHEVSCRKCS